MLTKEENEVLTRVRPGSLMGDLMRQYWIPFLLSTELPEPDGSTLRVRILGEDLIAFRDSHGRIGLLGNHCPHRGASLFYARNEEGGLRCIYHGWKFDVAGTCLDMPSEPPDSNFKDKIRHKAYPCRERGGIVWTYMGCMDPLPPLPDLEWNLVPDEQRYLAKRVQNCNFAQALEGEIDQSHVSFLHASHTQLKPEVGPGSANVEFWRKKDTHPRFHVANTEYGVLIGAQRDVDQANCYWRITQFLLPFYTMTGPYGENPTRQSRVWVPMDDETTLLIAANFHPLRALTDKEQDRLRKGSGAGFVGVNNFRTPGNEPDGKWRPRAGVENDFFFDRELQKRRLFSGIPEFWAQDAAVQESMGPIYDRSQEHLGKSDLAIIRVRQRLMEVAREFREQGTSPAGVLDPAIYRVRGAALVLPREANWLEATSEIRKVIPGVNPSAPGH